MSPVLGDLRHFGDLLTRNARIDGDAEGLVMGAERLTWRQTDARANRLAWALRKRGLERGDRVAILSHNCVPFVEALFALARSGLVAVPINSRLTAGEVASILEDCEARALLAGDALLETGRDAAGRASSVGLVAGLGQGQGEIPSYRRLLEEGEESEPPLERPIDGDGLLILLYTSGTTGFPKGVMYSHRGALLGTLVHVLAIGCARRHRVLLPSPLYSAAGFAGIACHVAVGSPCHLLQFSVGGALQALAAERITFTNLVPTTLAMMLEHDDFDARDLQHLEVLLYGGSPMPEPTLRRAAGVLSCGFRQTFATSETGLAGTVLEPEDHAAALEDDERGHLLMSCGRPQVGVGVRILGDDWQPLPRGEIGDIAVACDANMTGYWKAPEATAKVLRGGWLKTGDLARRDAEGYFYLAGRKHDMIVTGALNVYPSEVERALAEHPEVADSTVVGLPDPRWGEAVTAFVVRRPDSGVTASALLDFCRARLAPYKCPKVIHFLDQVPRNLAGKPLRRVLEQRFSENPRDESNDDS
ncbi:MAG: long-chain fatty acid--CoA ligase [bacterium]|nr:long-chain fatty acid--CoA ligase [bacterium]